MPLINQKNHTVEDIYALPDGERAELIDGQIYLMAPPGRTHQRIVTELTTRINGHIKNNRGTCEVNVAPFAVFLDSLNGENRNYVEPDITVVCEKDKLDEKGCHGAPDWILEVVSPSSRKLDYGHKQALYLEHGVREYWVIDPARQTVTVYRSSDDWIPSIYGFTDTICVGIFEDLQIDLAELKDLTDGK